MFHSTADALVPFNAISEKYAYQDFENDLPAGFTVNVNKLIEAEGLNKPMDEVLPEDDMEIYRIDSTDKDPALKNLKFTPGKRFSLNFVDEGRLNRRCDHFKQPLNLLAVSEMDFLSYYMERPAGMTNILTPPKLKVSAKRYLGQLDLLEEENAHKENCEPKIFGSLASDRLDVLLGIKVYLDLEYREEIRSGLLKNSITKVSYIADNLTQFMELYNGLGDELKFMKYETVVAAERFEKDPIYVLIKMIEHYKEKCRV